MSDVKTASGASPRMIEVVSLADGTSFLRADDGVAFTSDGIFPNARRQGLYDLLSKKKDGKPCFALKSRVAPLYAQDPLAHLEPFGAQHQALLDANLAARAVNARQNRARAKGELASIAANAEQAKPAQKAKVSPQEQAKPAQKAGGDNA